MVYRVSLPLAAAVLVHAVAAAQPPPSASSAAQDAPGQVLANIRGFSDDYQVGPGDQLDIQVIGHDSLRQTLRVSNSGEISYPMLGLIPVEDKTAFDIEEDVIRLLRERGLVQQPEVLVSVLEYQAKPIYVSGAVQNPGEFVMSQDLTVLDAILLAGGLRFNAADEALVHRRTPSPAGEPSEGPAVASSDGPGMTTLAVDLRPLKEGRFLEHMPVLRRGDVVVVPERPMSAFFVVGEVILPKEFYYTPGQQVLASQAISWAGGPTPTAKMSNGILVRFDEKGERIEMKVDYAAILRGEQPDIPVKPNDIFFVPGSKIKSLASGLVQLSDNMVMAASFRVARTYQLPDRADLPTREQP